MNVSKLDKKLDEALYAFSEDIRGLYREGDNSAATKSDIEYLARQVFYLMNDFKKALTDEIK